VGLEDTSRIGLIVADLDLPGRSSKPAVQKIIREGGISPTTFADIRGGKPLES
jgi:hypothetical protein